MNKPNLFQIATKELSQDGFLTWLIKWADDSFHDSDPELNKVAKDFVRLLIDKDSDFAITNVYAGRQWEHIDIWAEVNDNIAILIEDKKGAGEHGNQLVDYLQAAKTYYDPKGYELHPVFLKTGNYSLLDQAAVKSKGYKTICRKDLIDLFSGRKIDNAIYREFLDFLNIIEQETNNYGSVKNIWKSWYAAEGFYMRLEQELFPQESDWRYVANPSGGFQGFWYHWNSSEDFSEIYIQIENANSAIKLVVKVADGEEYVSCDSLYKALPAIQSIAREEGLSLSKPSRYRSGYTATLAIVDNAFDLDRPFSIDSFITILHALERTIDRFCEIS